MRFNRRGVPFVNSPRFTEELVTMLGDVMGNLAALFDRGISLTDNADCVRVSFTSNAAPNTEDTVAHTLRRVPTGFIVTSLDKAAIVYRGPTTFTSTNLYLRTNVATVAVQVLIF